jgi:predicted RNase H-like nuclease (RuvC/YqgF family)
MAKKKRIKGKIKGKVYVGDGIKEMRNKIDELTKENQEQKAKVDSLEQVIMVRVK